MVRIQFSIDLQYAIAAPSADFIFNFHAAPTACQTVVDEQLHINQAVPRRLHTDPATLSRYLRLQALPGMLQLRYQATVDIAHHIAQPGQIPEVPVAQLPPAVLSYLYPSRYCQSDRLSRLAMSEFGHLPQGYGRIQAICDWVRQHVSFRSNTTNSTTSAVDTVADRVGVCRDFAHLMIAICRALSIPARFTTGIDYGADPALGRTDFHAYVEVFLGQRWYIFDPSGTAIPMGFVRLGTGRDAADVSFATIFGSVISQPPLLAVSALADPATGREQPYRRSDALSTDAAGVPA